MRARSRPQPEQLGFAGLLAEAEQSNDRRNQERATAHLPSTKEEALPFFRALIERHHAAMLAADMATVTALRDEANRLATKLNNFEPGILADENAPGCVLDRETRAPSGKIPLWGQSGEFEIAACGMRVHIDLDGLFGIGARFMPWHGFSAHAVEWDKPFLSETGYRSFLGLSGELHPGMTPDTFVREVIVAHVRRELKGKLLRIKPEYRARAEAKP
jgi:hypothetical protein